MSQQATEPWEHGEAQVNGVRLHYVTAGSGPLVVLLHGFPEFWYSWRHQIPVLAGAGFQVLAPDMRGYNLSAKPADLASYSIDQLVNDVVGLVTCFGAERAILIGHDWGGVVAWYCAMRHPELFERLIVLNAPHPAAMLRELRRNVRQWGRSSYVGFFQLPLVPEWALSANNFALIRTMFRFSPRKARTFDTVDIDRMVAALAQPGALTAMLNYYRALFNQGPAALEQGTHTIRVPTLLIWGEHDPALDKALTKELDEWVPDLQLALIPEASHWVQNEEPETVNRLILAFLGS